MKKTRSAIRIPMPLRYLINLVLILALWFVLYTLIQNGTITNYWSGILITVGINIILATSLNVATGYLGQLPLGHAGFMSIGAFSGIITAMSLQSAVPSPVVRLVLALVVGAVFAALAGLIVGVPVLRLRGDYLAIVTLAAGEIIKELVNCLIVGRDENGLHIIFNATGAKSVTDLGLSETGKVIIKGAQGATGTQTISTFTAGFVLIMITLVIVLNLIHSRSGRAIMALRDNRIAAESVGINITKYKLMAFITSVALAGAAGALYGRTSQTSLHRNLTSTHPYSCWYLLFSAVWATSGARSSPPPC